MHGERQWCGMYCRTLFVLTLSLVLPRLIPSAHAVTVLDSTWHAEGGAKGHEAAGCGAHLRLAAAPPFRSVLALASDGKNWGEASGTARYDESFWFARVAPHRSWITGIFSGARFVE